MRIGFFFEAMCADSEEDSQTWKGTPFSFRILVKYTVPDPTDVA
jgi:hypothetical protein